jgi:BirA family biotin operon repressor/biotin-[acetyl-CoA-carboxylase] ligase
VLWSVGSTNSLLLERENPAVGTCEAVLAEHQTAGRGRRGRAWLAPPGGGICLSMSWTFPEVPRDLGAMGLVVGVCALRALSALRVGNVRLKWPNDLLIDDRKLGGVLIELRAESAGPACVIIGIGVNVALGAELPVVIARSGLAPTDLQGSSGTPPSRNAVAAELISAIIGGLLVFGQEGLRPFIDEWRAADALKGRAVSVQVADRILKGTARGIDASGSLLVETANGLQRLISGDVSVKAGS